MNYDEKLSLQQCKLREIDYPYCKYDEQLRQQYVVPRLSSEIEYPVAVNYSRHKILLCDLSMQKTMVNLFCNKTAKLFANSLFCKFYELPLSSLSVEVEPVPNSYPRDPEAPKELKRMSAKNAPLYKKDIKNIIGFVQRYGFPFVPYHVNEETLKNEPRSNYFEWFRQCHAQFCQLKSRIKHGADFSYDENLLIKYWLRLDAIYQHDFLPPMPPKIRDVQLRPFFPFTRLVLLATKLVEEKQRGNSIIDDCKICHELAYIEGQHDPEWYHCQQSSCVNAAKNWKRRGKPKSQQSK